MRSSRDFRLPGFLPFLRATLKSGCGLGTRLHSKYCNSRPHAHRALKISWTWNTTISCSLSNTLDCARWFSAKCQWKLWVLLLVWQEALLDGEMRLWVEAQMTKFVFFLFGVGLYNTRPCLHLKVSTLLSLLFVFYVKCVLTTCLLLESHSGSNSLLPCVFFPGSYVHQHILRLGRLPVPFMCLLMITTPHVSEAIRFHQPGLQRRCVWCWTWPRLQFFQRFNLKLNCLFLSQGTEEVTIPWPCAHTIFPRIKAALV